MVQMAHNVKHSATLVAFVLLAVACQPSDDRPAPAESEADIDLTDLIRYEPTAGDERDVYALGSCTDGETRECRVYLPSHNDVQPCFVGEQTCAGARWGECESGSVVDANADDAELDPSDLPE